MRKNNVFLDENDGEFDKIPQASITFGLEIGLRRCPKCEFWVLLSLNKHFESPEFHLWVSTKKRK